MIFKEKYTDIFEEYQKCSSKMKAMAFCCSGDLNLQAGISQKFDEKYGIEDKMKEFQRIVGKQYETGRAYLFSINYKEILLITLINRDKKWQGTTYDEMLECIKSLKKVCQEYYIEYLIIPRISCGLDMMNWEIIRPIIKEQFEDTDMNITVCYI